MSFFLLVVDPCYRALTPAHQAIVPIREHDARCHRNV
jgi:hypothetical protein